MPDLPKISIVTPSYNQGEFIEATIRSVLDQNYPNLEYIVMDGGSTDGSVDIIKKYANRLTHWESHPDKGQADAIYRGFERATGEILGWVNSDDLLISGCLDKTRRYFATHPEEEWVVGGTILIDRKGGYVPNSRGNPRCNLGGRIKFHRLLFSGCGFNQPASFWRRETFFDVGGFDRSLRFCFDYDLYFRLAQRRPSGNIRDFLACFRKHPASKSNTIQNIRDAENELLRHKYGRYQKSELYRKSVAMWYITFGLVKARIIQIKLILGFLKIPL
ncbi:glycosyltransferase family 2 protein [Thermodesulfobacteriota bacterium]